MSARGKLDAWFQDQYCHPHETHHTLSEVLGWMEEDGLEFVNSIPKPEVGLTLSADEQLFAPRHARTALSRIVSQAANMKSGYSEGGFFIVIGRLKT